MEEEKGGKTGERNAPQRLLCNKEHTKTTRQRDLLEEDSETLREGLRRPEPPLAGYDPSPDAGSPWPVQACGRAAGSMEKYGPAAGGCLVSGKVRGHTQEGWTGAASCAHTDERTHTLTRTLTRTHAHAHTHARTHTLTRTRPAGLQGDPRPLPVSATQTQSALSFSTRPAGGHKRTHSRGAHTRDGV